MGAGKYLNLLKGQINPADGLSVEEYIFRLMLKLIVKGASPEFSNLQAQAIADGDQAAVSFFTELLSNGAIASQAGVLPEFDNGNSGATPTIDLSKAPSQKLTLNSNATLSLINPVAGTSYLLKCVQDRSGPRLITWPGEVKWPAGTPQLCLPAAMRSTSLCFIGTAQIITETLDSTTFKEMS